MLRACTPIEPGTALAFNEDEELTLRIGTEPVNVGASLVGAHAALRMQPAESDEGNHEGCPYNAQHRLLTFLNKQR